MYTKIKGTKDIYGKEAEKLSYIEYCLRRIASIYGFEEIRVPILSSTELIHRSSGDGSDIVTKETFDFLDRGDRKITLRPEGTAPVLRAIIENKLYTNPLPLKYFYFGNMFRYERPQKGRYREFSQFGVECIGSNSPYTDASIITLADTIFKMLEVTDTKVKINSLGDDESREQYKEALKEYFKDKLDSLCDDCKKRYETNPLRILDCKVDKDSELFKNAPVITDYLNEKSLNDFNLVKSYLDSVQVQYEVDSNLVRGLDYYTNTIFEIEKVIDGSPLTICAGGRYNNLIKTLGGPDLGAMGFAFGLERLISICPDSDVPYKKALCQIIPIGEEAKKHLVILLENLRLIGLPSEMNFDATNLKQHFKSAEQNQARFIIIQGDDELANEEVKIKDKDLDTEVNVKESKIEEYLMEILSEENESHHCGHECCCGECDEN